MIHLKRIFTGFLAILLIIAILSWPFIIIAAIAFYPLSSIAFLTLIIAYALGEATE